jgi:hypothetical protein
MARAHRVGFVSVVATVVYVLTLYNVLSVPLLDQKISTQILPVVCLSLPRPAVHYDDYWLILSTHTNTSLLTRFSVQTIYSSLRLHRFRGGYWYSSDRTPCGPSVGDC